jgi:hypothetical protein
MLNSNWDNDDGLSAAALRQDVLNAGVQHLMRTGIAYASRPWCLSNERQGIV